MNYMKNIHFMYGVRLLNQEEEMTKIEKIKSDEASKEFIVLLFVVMFAALAVILHFNPILVDDYEFLSYNRQSFTEAIDYALNYGNGRFLGNLGAILLAPHTVIAALFKAFTVSLLCILLPMIFNATEKSVYLLSCLLVLTVPEKMFAQVHAWNCGNVNYILPIILTILCLLLIKAKDAGRFAFVMKCFGIFVFGFCSQLFMEHNTLVNFLIAVSLFGYLLIKRKQYTNAKCLLSFFWAAAASLGAAVMLLIPMFFKGERTRNMSAYRGFEIKSIRSLIISVLENGAEMVSHFAANAILLLVLGMITYLLLKGARAKSDHSVRFLSALKTTNIICLCFDIIYCLFVKNLQTDYSTQRILKIAVCAVCALEVLIFFITCFICFQSKNRSISVICLALFICSLAPLLVIKPIGERTSFLGTAVLIFTALYFFRETVGKANVFSEVKQRIALIGSVAAILSCLFVSFFSINEYIKSLNTYIESEMQKGSKVIEIFKVPIPYCHESTGMLEYRYYYKEYGDINFKIVTPDQWERNRIAEEKTEN